MSQQVPDIWIHSMRQGKYETAWDHCDQVLQSRAGKLCWHWPRHLQYIWKGEPLNGKRVLVRCYHGLGDTIQFIRYAPLLKSVASEVIVWAQPKLLRLLQSVQGIDRLIPLHDGTPEAAFDVDVEIMELPYIFRSTIDTIPAAIPYLHIDKKPLQNNGRPNVGLVWRAGDWNENRSIPFALMRTLAELKHINFHILQPGAIEAGWDNTFGIYHGELDVYDYAQLIAGLNLLISIDSMPVHLAGALGVPVWTMLQAEADWRWMDQLEYSPWYPTMRLFRQHSPGKWEPVIRRIAEELTVMYKGV